MAVSHLDGLAEELKAVDIFTNADQNAPGKWEGNVDTSRIFNHDETPQFINYGVDGTPHGLVYAARGESFAGLLLHTKERELKIYLLPKQCAGFYLMKWVVLTAF